MKRLVYSFIIVSILGIVSLSSVWAGNVEVPHTFTAGTAAKANEVNENFNSVKTAVDDNNSNITDHINDTDIHQSKYTDAEAVNAIFQKGIDGHSLNAGDGDPNDVVFVDDEGNVGIGTKIPSATLNVKGTLSKALTGTVSVLKNYSNVVGYGTLFSQELNEGDSILIGAQILTVKEIIDDMHLDLNSNHLEGANNIVAYIDNDLYIVETGNNVKKFIIDHSGNVGIGISNPEETLDASGTIKATSYLGDGSKLSGIITTETDPTVQASVKDGVSWDEISGIPSGFEDGIDDMGIIIETDPTVKANVKDGVSWGEISGIPSGFADGTDDLGIPTETDPTVQASVKDGVSWGEISGIPSDFADSKDDIGITIETDPTVKASVKDGVSWDEISGIPPGFADGTDDNSESIFEDSFGNVGIGTGNPNYKLDVIGDINFTGNLFQNESPFSNGGDGHSLDAADGDPIDAVYVDSNGNVGIGTINPNRRLHVETSDATTALFKGKTTNAVVRIEGMGQHNVILDLGHETETGPSKEIHFDAGFNGISYFNAMNGKVGIGTTEPEAKLHVKGDVKIEGDLKIPEYANKFESPLGKAQFFKCLSPIKTIKIVFPGGCSAGILYVTQTRGGVAIANAIFHVLYQSHSYRGRVNQISNIGVCSDTVDCVVPVPVWNDDKLLVIPGGFQSYLYDANIVRYQNLWGEDVTIEIQEE